MAEPMPTDPTLEEVREPLKPCPFCGSDIGPRASRGSRRPTSYIECLTCTARGPDCRDEETAREAWNRRAPLPAPPPELCWTCGGKSTADGQGAVCICGGKGTHVAEVEGLRRAAHAPLGREREPTNAELLELAKKHPAPAAWWRGDNERPESITATPGREREPMPYWFLRKPAEALVHRVRAFLIDNDAEHERRVRESLDELWLALYGPNVAPPDLPSAGGAEKRGPWTYPGPLTRTATNPVLMGPSRANESTPLPSGASPAERAKSWAQAIGREHFSSFYHAGQSVGQLTMEGVLARRVEGLFEEIDERTKHFNGMAEIEARLYRQLAAKDQEIAELHKRLDALRRERDWYAQRPSHPPSAAPAPPLSPPTANAPSGRTVEQRIATLESLMGKADTDIDGIWSRLDALEARPLPSSEVQARTESGDEAE